MNSPFGCLPLPSTRADADDAGDRPALAQSTPMPTVDSKASQSSRCLLRSPGVLRSTWVEFVQGWSSEVEDDQSWMPEGSGWMLEPVKVLDGEMGKSAETMDIEHEEGLLESHDVGDPLWPSTDVLKGISLSTVAGTSLLLANSCRQFILPPVSDTPSPAPPQRASGQELTIISKSASTTVTPDDPFPPSFTTSATSQPWTLPDETVPDVPILVPDSPLPPLGRGDRGFIQTFNGPIATVNLPPPPSPIHPSTQLPEPSPPPSPDFSALLNPQRVASPAPRSVPALPSTAIATDPPSARPSLRSPAQPRPNASSRPYPVPNQPTFDETVRDEAQPLAPVFPDIDPSSAEESPSREPLPSGSHTPILLPPPPPAPVARPSSLNTFDLETQNLEPLEDENSQPTESSARVSSSLSDSQQTQTNLPNPVIETSPDLSASAPSLPPPLPDAAVPIPVTVSPSAAPPSRAIAPQSDLSTTAPSLPPPLPEALTPLPVIVPPPTPPPEANGVVGWNGPVGWDDPDNGNHWDADAPNAFPDSSSNSSLSLSGSNSSQEEPFVDSSSGTLSEEVPERPSQEEDGRSTHASTPDDPSTPLEEPDASPEHPSPPPPIPPLAIALPSRDDGHRAESSQSSDAAPSDGPHPNEPPPEPSQEPSPENSRPSLPTFRVERFEVTGSSIFDAVALSQFAAVVALNPSKSASQNDLQQLCNAILKGDGPRIMGAEATAANAALEHQSLIVDSGALLISISDLIRVSDAITYCYTSVGYVNSGALISPEQLEAIATLPPGEPIPISIQVIEGGLEAINVEIARDESFLNAPLRSGYVRRRLAGVTDAPFNINDLVDAVQLLEQDPLIESISTQIVPGTQHGTSILQVNAVQARSFTLDLASDNSRSPSVGTFQQTVGVSQANLLGRGDRLSIGYRHTNGSDGWDFSYAIPINAQDGTIQATYGFSHSEVIEEPFDELDIQSDFRQYELSYRQPIVRSPHEELALSLTAARLETDGEFLEALTGTAEPFPSRGSDEDGETRLSVLRFSQDWTKRNSNQVFSIFSEFSLGLDVSDATVNEARPDGRFFSWKGQGQWVQRLATDTLFVMRGGLQIADGPLVPLEQFAVGGPFTVRGYRSNTVLADNGWLASAEVRVPILRIPEVEGILQVAPFVEAGGGWNNGDFADPDPGTLWSTGLGLIWRMGDAFSARLDWGIPLTPTSDDGDSLQESGVHFSIQLIPL